MEKGKRVFQFKFEMTVNKGKYQIIQNLIPLVYCLPEFVIVYCLPEFVIV
jgi:hypothetical protein